MVLRISWVQAAVGQMLRMPLVPASWVQCGLACCYKQGVLQESCVLLHLLQQDSSLIATRLIAATRQGKDATIKLS